ncbi:MAG: alpha/beta fold hydrolase [Anaerolineales bacterium]|nr:alpha/beta fold hydrolase [Anaerolineales bacterium]
MSLFRRAIRTFLITITAAVSLIVAIAAYFARRVVKPPRQKLWATPDDVGLPYEDIQFPARQDAARLSGWFVPAVNGNGKTIVMVHGWPWNRLGEAAEGLMANVLGASAVDLLRLAHTLHHAGYNVIMYDSRNHGESAEKGGVTFGFAEANDLLGVLDYLQTRSDIDHKHIGVIGFSMGGNTTLYALARTDMVKAAVVVQPTSMDHFTSRLGRNLFGRFGQIIVPLSEWMVQKMGGIPFNAVNPLYAAPAIRHTPVLFVQGQGDPWGSPANVQEIAQATPTTVDTLLVDSRTRYEGYRYVIDHPEILTTFFADYI